MRKKLLIVTGSLRAGGTERQVAYLATALAVRGVEVQLALLENHRAAYGLPDSVAVHYLRADGAGWVRAGARLRALARDCEVAYSLLDVANVFASLCLVGTGIRLVWGVRAAGISAGAIARWAFRLARLLSRQVPLIVANAEAVKAFYLNAGFSPGTWQVVANGVDSERFKPDPLVREATRKALGIGQDDLTVGMIARADPCKRHDALLAAVAVLRREFPGLKCLLVGTGTDSAEMRRLIEKYAVQEQVLALGEREDVAKLTAALDVAVSVSEFEGCPNSVLEAMACAVCVAATDVGDTARLLAGWGLVLRDNSQDEVVAALRGLFSNSQERQRLADKARERVLNCFSTERMAERTWEVLTRSAEGL